MRKDITLSNLGEVKAIQIIDDLIFEKTGKRLIWDDSFYFELFIKNNIQSQVDNYLVLNTDMLVSTTDAPSQMNYYQIGRKSVIMNISDLIVKGVKPKAIIISLGLPRELLIKDFKKMMEGIVDYCVKYDLDYIGGDLNETKEIIINPTVFGIQKRSKIVHRTGLKEGDQVVVNGKFGLTGVGFDILLKKGGSIDDYPKYKKSINAVLEPELNEKEAYILVENDFATASIDSSDGLAKSLTDLMVSTPDIGFEIEFNDELIEKEAKSYSEEFNMPIENLVFNGGEEFLHLFTIDPKNYDLAQNAVKNAGGNLFKIGRVISENNIYIVKDNKKIKLKGYGFEHFVKKV